MGQKVHPIGLRLGITKPWNSRWFSEKDYADQLHEDLRVRKYIKERLSHAGVSHIEMERAAKRLRINIHTGAYLTDQGIIEGEAHDTLRYRKALAANNVSILADVLVKHARPLGETDVARDHDFFIELT